MIKHGYQKMSDEVVSTLNSLFSNLYKARLSLKKEVLSLPESQIRRHLLFHIESSIKLKAEVDLESVQNAIVHMANVAMHGGVKEEIQEWIGEIQNITNMIIRIIKVNA